MGSEINIIHLNSAKKLDFPVYKIILGVQKIDDLKLDTFCMIIIFFLMEDKEKRFHFIEETFLLADITIDITPIMAFCTLSNVKSDFLSCHIY